MRVRVGVELAKAIRETGRTEGSILIVRAGAQTALAQDHDAIQKALCDLLAKAPAAGEVHTETIADRALPPEIAGGERVPVALQGEWLSALMVKYSKTTAIVSLLGEPVSTAETLASLPPLFCHSEAGGEHLAEFVRSGVVLAAIAPRHSAPPVETKDWFDIRYTVVTPANVEQWAAGKM